MKAEPRVSDIDAIFERYSRPGSPGCAVAVMKGGEIVFEKGYGLANLELGAPVTPSTVFNIGSMAKQFTAFAIALLEGEGKLSLGDDMRAYLPEMHAFDQTISLRHLIHHSSGLRGSFPELLALAEWRDTDMTTTEDVFWLLKRQRELSFPPGEEYLYVNSNYVLLALICQRVSGISFAEFCQERIFGPLGMARSTINDSIFKLIPGRALGYYDDENGAWFNAPLNDSVVGPTNVYTTVQDLARWDENFYTGQVGGRAVVERMEEAGRLNNGVATEYAFGLMVGAGHEHRGWQMVEHGGGQGGYGSWMVRFPELHLSVAVLFNHFLWWMRDYTLKVADLFLEDEPSLAAGAPVNASTTATTGRIRLTDQHMAERAGLYFDGRRAAVREVSFLDGKLQFQGHALVPLSDDRFYIGMDPGNRVTFLASGEGNTVGLTTSSTAGDFSYERVFPAAAHEAELAKYPGRYYSPELDITWLIEAGEARLTAKRRKYIDSRLTPLFGDVFRDDWGPLMGYPTSYLVVFQRDDQGKVAGLRVSGHRVRHLWFERQGG